MTDTHSLIIYETARAALKEARYVDEVLNVRNMAERMRLYGKQAKDKSMMADAMEIQLRAERRLGVMIVSAKESGHLGIGRPARSNLDGAADEGDEAEDDNGSAPEPFTRTTLSEAGIDKKLSMNAQVWARMGDDDFAAKLAEVRDKIVSTGAAVVNPHKDLSTAAKKARRADREKALGAKQMALPEAKFGVIYADPEWKFSTYSEETGMDRSADNHYPTSDLETIKSRDIGSLAADDCALFLWATVPMLPQAIEVMTAWGFEYKSNFNWHKDQIGTGYWNRNRHELLLIGTRGNIPAPAMGDQFDSSIAAPVGAHSAKPAVFYEIIEAYFPSLPKIELNARVARPGWVRWGYEAPEEEAGEVSASLVAKIATGMQTEAGRAALLTAVDIMIDRENQDAAEGAFVQRADLREQYEGELALVAHNKGKLTMTSAAQAMRAGYAAEVPILIMAQDLGHPKGTISAWAGRLGLASRERLTKARSSTMAEAAE